jgi:hypothetical protein
MSQPGSAASVFTWICCIGDVSGTANQTMQLASRFAHCQRHLLVVVGLLIGIGGDAMILTAIYHRGIVLLPEPADAPNDSPDARWQF